jgi:type I restriction enzyme, R subunit
MLAHDRLLDIVENFILFDESKAGATRKVVARNHQVLGVNMSAKKSKHVSVKSDRFVEDGSGLPVHALR